MLHHFCISERGGIALRKCIRCGAEMKEGFTFTGGGGNVIRRKGLSLKAVYPKAAVCFNCGEVSIYVEDLDKLKSDSDPDE